MRQSKRLFSTTKPPYTIDKILLFSPFFKVARMIKERGFKGLLKQMYLTGEVKNGTFKGQDVNGNKYYENLEMPFGQHRWVEYSNIHNPDPTMIHPDWHGWMHHMFDETPDEYVYSKNKEIAQLSHATAVTDTHVYNVPAGAVAQEEMYNLSQYRQRGYNVGSLMSGAKEPDKYYKQPGHPLSKDTDVAEGGRFRRPKGYTEFDPNNPKYMADLEKLDRTNESREQ